MKGRSVSKVTGTQVSDNQSITICESHALRGTMKWTKAMPRLPKFNASSSELKLITVSHN
jgi:hypothetical protein